ncbi:cyclin-domain-containing protein [Xylogone sp. PMI_703]|nr:cyclin-domain-containing protein [Xylogone sp. PMI_703]
MNVDDSKKILPELENEDSKSQLSVTASTSTAVETLHDRHPSKPAPIAESPTMKRRQSVPFDISGSHTADKSQILPPKRPRPAQTQVKVLPLRYELCEVEDMVILIANMISELIQTNDELPLRTGVLTRFHSRTPPGISVMDYLHRLAKHATLTPPLLLSMVYYIDRLCALYPAFTITTLTVHRFLITAATVAAKGLSDSFWNNATYARVGGVKVAELGLLELDFLYRVDWRIVPNPEVLVDYYRGLVERSEGYVLEGDDELSIDRLVSEGDDEDDEDEENEEDEDGGESREDSKSVAESRLHSPGNSQHHNTPPGLLQRGRMRVPSCVYLIFAPALIIGSLAAQSNSASVYIQEIGTSTRPTSLAKVTYDVSTLQANLTSFEVPGLSGESKLARIGTYDPAKSAWTSSTSLTSMENFSKGYATTLLLSISDDGSIIGVTCKGSKIDAGQTRDFGPKVKLSKSGKGKRPELNKPVVLSPEGKLPEEAPEKTLLQKYAIQY